MTWTQLPYKGASHNQPCFWLGKVSNGFEAAVTWDNTRLRWRLDVNQPGVDYDVTIAFNKRPEELITLAEVLARSIEDVYWAETAAMNIEGVPNAQRTA
jgi:hypothetical protein